MRKKANVSARRILSAQGGKITRYAVKCVALCLIAGGMTACQHSSGQKIMNQRATYVVAPKAVESIKFTSKNVKELYFAENSGWCFIVYVDKSQGLYHEILRVDPETYEILSSCLNTKCGEMNGYLVEKDGIMSYKHEL